MKDYSLAELKSIQAVVNDMRDHIARFYGDMEALNFLDSELVTTEEFSRVSYQIRNAFWSYNSMPITMFLHQISESLQGEIDKKNS